MQNRDGEGGLRLAATLPRFIALPTLYDRSDANLACSSSTRDGDRRSISSGS